MVSGLEVGRSDRRANKMSGLDPHLASGRTAAPLEGTPHREPQPGLRLEAFATLFEASFEHQELLAAAVPVAGEVALRRVAHDRSGPRNPSPIRPSMRRSTPRMGEGTQGIRAAWTAARAEKSAFRFMAPLR